MDRPDRTRDRRATRPRGPRPIVCVFARAPEPGTVKTRLTPILRAAEAADLYRAMLIDTVEVAASIGSDVVVAFTPHAARASLEQLLGRHQTYMPQGPGDLGQRLAYAFERLCDGRRPVMVVGSDCPGLSAERLREAVDAVSGDDEVAIGPTIDGGYYLIGLTRARPRLFEDVPWSTERVFEATMERIREAGLRARTLATERDIDTPEDILELYAGTRSAEWEEAYPRTWKELHTLLPPRRLSMLEEAVAERSRERAE